MNNNTDCPFCQLDRNVLDQTPAHDSLESRGFGSNYDKQKPTTRIKKHKPITIDIENLRKQFILKSKGEKK